MAAALGTWPEDWGRSYLVLDVNALFVAASLREELWLYLGREDPGLLSRVCRAAEAFQIRTVDADRDLATYSGGEQAIIAALLTLYLIRELDLQSRRLLLCGVLESISRDNRRRLNRYLHATAQSHHLEVYHLWERQVRPLDLEACES